MKTYIHPPVSDVPFTDVMQALSDPCRIQIMKVVLDAGEVCCKEVPLTVSKATRSHHFDVLRNAGLIFTRAVGTRCMTSVRREEIDGKFPGLLDLVLKEETAA